VQPSKLRVRFIPWHICFEHVLPLKIQSSECRSPEVVENKTDSLHQHFSYISTILSLFRAI